MESNFSFMKNDKKNQKIIWDDVLIFLAVARHGTLGYAAKHLGLGISTLSRRIERLEAALGVSLFAHHQSGYKLTAEGAHILPSAEAMETAAMTLLSRCRTPGEVVGSVRLATTEMLASELILPALPVLQRELPQLSLEIITDSKIVNIHQFDADLALRLVKPESGNVVIRRLGELGFSLYSSQQYSDNLTDHSPDYLYANGRFVGWAEALSHLPMAKWTAEKLKGRALVLETTSLATQVAAVSAGAGVALLPHFIAQRHGLVRLSETLNVKYPLWLVIHSDLSHTPRVRRVANFLTGLVHDNQLRLSGELSRLDDYP